MYGSEELVAVFIEDVMEKLHVSIYVLNI